MRASLRWAMLCLVVAATTRPPPAMAQSSDDSTRDAARSLAADGRVAYRAGDYPRAIELFHKAFALFPAPTISLYEARALARSGQLVEAAGVYTKTMGIAVDDRSPEQFHRAVRDAEAELAELKPRIPRVVLDMRPPPAATADLTIILDGVTWNRELLGVEAPANPGRHRVAARTPEGDRASQVFTLAEGESKHVELVLESAPVERAAPDPSTRPIDERLPGESSPSSRRMIGYVAIGVGAAGIGTGIVAGLLASSRYDDAESQCPDHRCTEGTAGGSSLAEFRTLRTVSTVGYVMGGVGIATGVTMLLVHSKAGPRSRSASVRPWIGAGCAGVAGAF
jgi:hypothetical protein